MTEPPRLDFARLTDWVEDRLSVEEAQHVAAQVAQADEATRAQVAWLRAFRSTSAAIVLQAPPAETRALLTARFAEYARQQRGPGLFQRFLATLSFDSALQGAAAGVRAANMQAPLRQMVYAAEIADIALAIQPRPRDQWLDLSGQLLPKQVLDLASFRVSLQRGANEIAATIADDLGEFTFEALEPGVYALSLTAPAIDIVLASVELRR